MEFSDIGASWKAFWERKWYWLGLGFLAGIPSEVYLAFWGVVPRFNLRPYSPNLVLSYFAFLLGVQVIYLLVSSATLRAALSTWRREVTLPSLLAKLPVANLVLIALAIVVFDTFEFGLPKAVESHSVLIQAAFLGLRVLCAVPLMLVVPYVVDQKLAPLDAVTKSVRAMLPGAGHSLLVLFAFALTLTLAASPLLALMFVPVPKNPETLSVGGALIAIVARCALSSIVLPVSQLFTARVYLRRSGQSEPQTP